MMTQTITQDEIDVMNTLVTNGIYGWCNNKKLASIVATVCLKTGVSDAQTLVKYWGTEIFQLGLVEMGLVNLDTGSVN